MGKSKTTTSNNIVKFTCSACHANTIYINVSNHQNNNAPFKAKQFVCTECEQDLGQFAQQA